MGSGGAGGRVRWGVCVVRCRVGGPKGVVAGGWGSQSYPPTPIPLPKRDSIGNRTDSETGDCCKPNNHPPKHRFIGNHTDLGVGDWVIVGFLK